MKVSKHHTITILSTIYIEENLNKTMKNVKLNHPFKKTKTKKTHTLNSKFEKEGNGLWSELG